MTDRRSLLSSILALPAALMAGRSTAAATKPEPRRSGRCCSNCEGMTDEQARLHRDVYAANAIQRLLDRERDQTYGIPFIATEGDYEVDKSHDPDMTAEKFIAELSEERQWDEGDHDVAVWRGRRCIAVLEGMDDGTPKVTRFDDVQAETRYTVDDETLKGRYL
jgi:hypothetical protein